MNASNKSTSRQPREKHISVNSLRRSIPRKQSSRRLAAWIAAHRSVRSAVLCTTLRRILTTLSIREDWEAAYEVLSSTNSFPEFTSRVCPALCESGCVLNYTSKPMGVKSVERAIITHAWNQGWVKPQIPAQLNGKSVAVIGSGPSGLACAQQLARKGYSVTVFEKNSKAGGLLRFGIPDFKLDKTVIERRISQMEAEGVQFRYNTYIGTGEHLRASGLTQKNMWIPPNFFVILTRLFLPSVPEEPRDLPVKGRKGAGVHFAMEYLPRQNKINDEVPVKEEINAKNKKVLIIGGGDTGSDCLGTAVRQGCG